MVKPFNVTTPGAAGTFKACKELGWENFACSPFVRGWQMEKVKEQFAEKGGDPESVP